MSDIDYLGQVTPATLRKTYILAKFYRIIGRGVLYGITLDVELSEPTRQIFKKNAQVKTELPQKKAIVFSVITTLSRIFT